MANKKEQLTTELVLDTKKFKKELKKIKTELTKVSSSLKGLSKGKIKINTSEISTAKKQVEKLKSEVKSISGTVNVKTNVGSVKAPTSGGGGISAKGLGAGVFGAAITGIGLKGLDQDTAKRSFKTRFSGSIQDAEYALTDIELISVQTGKTFGEVADTFLSLKKAGLEGNQLLKSTKTSLGIQEAFGEKDTDIARAVRSTTKEFGVNGEKATAGIQLLLKEAGNLEGETLDSLWEYAIQQKNAGFNFEDSLKMSLQAAKSGIWNVDKLFDFVKESDLRLGDVKSGKGTTEQLDSLSKLGISVDQVKSQSTKETLDMIRENSKGSDLKGGELRSVLTPLLGTQLEDIGGIQKFIETADIKVTLAPDWDKVLNTRLLQNQFEGVSATMGKVNSSLDLMADKIFSIFTEDTIDKFGGRSVTSYGSNSSNGSTIVINANNLSAEEIIKVQKEYDAKNS